LKAIVIAGPTASGKTTLAVDTARMLGGPVINADSMQVYDWLAIITARPTSDEMLGVEHLLFGHVHPSRAYSVAQYLGDVAPVLAGLDARGLVPVIAGGTGLYFKALFEGLAPVPDIDDAIRQSLRGRGLSESGALYHELQSHDPQAAAALEPGDSQRIIRALEVVLSTGKTLAWWQDKQQQEPILRAEECLKIVLLPERDIVRARIAERFEKMVTAGVVEEIEALLALGLPAELPAMRAIGVPQLARYINGDCDLSDAVQLAVNATRQYAKRQSTWFRNQFGKLPASETDPFSNWHFCPTIEAASTLINSCKEKIVNHTN